MRAADLQMKSRSFNLDVVFILFLAGSSCVKSIVHSILRTLGTFDSVVIAVKFIDDAVKAFIDGQLVEHAERILGQLRSEIGVVSVADPCGTFKEYFTKFMGFRHQNTLRPMTVNPADRQACVLGILRKESPASTKRIIELASTTEFQEICRDCRSGVEVYETAMKLQREGLISRTAGKGGFIWALVKHQRTRGYSRSRHLESDSSQKTRKRRHSRHVMA